jgi:hypothetical protein
MGNMVFEGLQPRKSDVHIWDREKYDHYVEPRWVSERLFDAEYFVGEIIGPACGFGNIVEAARAHGYSASGRDIVDRGYSGTIVQDFMSCTDHLDNIVCNIPFDIAPEFTQHALKLIRYKLAFIFPVARLYAAHRWLEKMPLARIWLLTSRPSMPPGRLIAAGRRPGGGKMDYCWLIFSIGHVGMPELRWLHRDIAAPSVGAPPNVVPVSQQISILTGGC